MCMSLPQGAVTALWRGQVLEAIKLVRVEQDIGLEEAKELVDAYVHTQSGLRNRIGQTHADARDGLIRWLIFCLVGGAALYLFLS